MCVHVTETETAKETGHESSELGILLTKAVSFSLRELLRSD